MTQLHAQPFDISAYGFYFESEAEFNDKASKARNDYGQATATILGVRGSTVLKAGRHIVHREAGRDIIDINWTDYDSSPQALRLVIDKSGEFQVRSGDSRVTNPAQQMVCGLLGGYCEVAAVTSHVEMSSFRGGGERSPTPAWALGGRFKICPKTSTIL